MFSEIRPHPQPLSREERGVSPWGLLRVDRKVSKWGLLRMDRGVWTWAIKLDEYQWDVYQQSEYQQSEYQQSEYQQSEYPYKPSGGMRRARHCVCSPLLSGVGLGVRAFQHQCFSATSIAKTELKLTSIRKLAIASNRS